MKEKQLPVALLAVRADPYKQQDLHSTLLLPIARCPNHQIKIQQIRKTLFWIDDGRATSQKSSCFQEDEEHEGDLRQYVIVMRGRFAT